jgi:tRNA(fMet)-specific endonuclease VapC
MKYLLDSNILIAIGLDANDGVISRAGERDADEMVTSAIAYAEVVHGSARGKPPPVERLEALFDEVPVLPFDIAAAKAYADLSFERHSYDRLIAAHALSLNLIVVTDNMKDFADVPGLKVENWTV